MDTPFTSALQAFFRDAVNWPWAEQFPRALFIRDFENLPERSPHDIDLLMDKDHHKSFLAHVSERADAFGLVCVTWSAEAACFALVFDLDTGNEGRAWAFFEVREAIAVTPEQKITASDVDIVRDGPTGLPSLREGFVVQPSKVDRSAQPSAPPLRTRIDHCLFRNFYTPHYARPLFFTIHGPDGVGKTTTCAEVEKTFARLPLEFSSFHHITGWKYPTRDVRSEPTQTARGSGGEEWQPGPLHLFMRWVYRKLPGSIQRTYVLIQGYDMYLRKLNAMIYSGYCLNSIMFVDRYIYDIVTKNVIQDYGARWVHQLFIRLARPPVRAFILTDSAEAIRKRKQELTVSEIESYQRIMRRLISRRGLNFEQIVVGDMAPQAIARIICRKILEDSGSALAVQMMPGKTKA